MAELTPASRWLLIVREKADEAKKNAEGLRKFEGMEQEARARELGAQYLIEVAQLLVMDEQYADELAAVVDQSKRIADLRAALSGAEDAERVNALLVDWVRQARDGGAVDSPGHGHDVPGVWDGDKVWKAGMRCAQCALWSEAKVLAARAQPNGGERTP